MEVTYNPTAHEIGLTWNFKEEHDTHMLSQWATTAPSMGIDVEALVSRHETATVYIQLLDVPSFYKLDMFAAVVLDMDTSLLLQRLLNLYSDESAIIENLPDIDPNSKPLILQKGIDVLEDDEAWDKQFAGSSTQIRELVHGKHFDAEVWLEKYMQEQNQKFNELGELIDSE